MPNWCGNCLVIQGSKEDIAKFKEFGKGTSKYGKFDWLQADNFIPYPKDLEEMDLKAHQWREKADAYAEKLAGVKNWWCGDKLTKSQRDAFVKENGEEPKDGFNAGGYEWCSKNWGTKWGFCDVSEPTDDGDMLTYIFDTAWAPPIPLIVKAAELFPTLKFEISWEEPGMCFAGEAKFENGKVVSVEDRELHYCPECYTDMDVINKETETYSCLECNKKYKWEKENSRWVSWDEKTESWIVFKEIEPIEPDERLK